jgi:hypothetical protein
MNTNEAKFILRARRANGRDDAEPAFAEALAQARLEPELAAWLAKERGFDEAVTARLREVAPPSGLRDAILAGARMQARTPWWRQTHSLAWAATVAVVLGLSATWGVGQMPPSGERLALGALREWHDPLHHPVVLNGTGELRKILTNPAAALRAGLPQEFNQLKREGCRVLTIAGREVLEVCFERSGIGEFHLYIARRGDFRGMGREKVPVFREQGALTAVAWAGAEHDYVLVSADGGAALRQIL